MEQQLNDIRQHIDNIDNEILSLLNRRMELVQKVGNIKRANNGVIYRPEREKAILDRLNNLNQGLLSMRAIESVFLEIFAVSRNFELPERIAYLGPEGSFTHQAAESRFGAMSNYIKLNTIQSVFESVITERVKYGIVPIENNQEGSVHETIDALGNIDVKIVGEIPMPIHFTFASQEDRLNKITKVYSKDIAFRQCKKFIQEYLPEPIELIPVESTSKAAKLASEEPHSAAICAHVAAKIYNLPLLFENIEDSMHNRTRFLILSRTLLNQYNNQNKTTIIAHLADKAGSLARLLQDFSEAKINLCKVDSRPSRQDEQFKYWFLIEFDGHFEDGNVKWVLERNKEYVKLLGSYIKLC